MNQSQNIIDGIFLATGLLGAGISSTIQDWLGIALTIINIVYLLVIIGLKVYAKIIKAKEDGKITAEEVDDIRETIESEVEKHGKK